MTNELLITDPSNQIARLRADLLDPPLDVQERVIQVLNLVSRDALEAECEQLRRDRERDGICVTLDENAARIVCDALETYRKSLDMHSPHGRYREPFLLDLRDTLQAAMTAMTKGEGK